MVNEDTMQTKRIRTHDERRVKNLLLVHSIGLSFATYDTMLTERSRSLDARRFRGSAHSKSKEIDRTRAPNAGQVAQFDAPSRSVWCTKSIGQTRKRVEAACTRQSRQIEQPAARQCAEPRAARGWSSRSSSDPTESHVAKTMVGVARKATVVPVMGDLVTVMGVGVTGSVMVSTLFPFHIFSAYGGLSTMKIPPGPVSGYRWRKKA